ncbi:MAG: hypothetical protein U0939_24105 [Pirellulales bacterium]
MAVGEVRKSAALRRRRTPILTSINAPSSPRASRLSSARNLQWRELLSTWLAPTLWGAWCLVIAVLAFRAPAGPPPASSLLMAVASLGTVAFAGGLHVLWNMVQRRRWTTVGDLWITTASLALAAAITFPNSPAPGVIVLWAGIVAFETAWWAAWRCADEPGNQVVLSVVAATDESTLEGQSGEAIFFGGEEQEEGAEEGETLEDEERPLLPDGVEQQWTRGVAASGVEWLEGLVRVNWTPRQKHASVPLSFCPPLASAPSVSAQSADGGDAEVVVAQTHTFGARLEVRRATASSLPDSLILLVRVNRDDD